MPYWDYYEPSRPKEAKGGIKAQSSSFGKSWWAKRWMAILDSYGLGARLTRGRSYARSGQVLSIDISEGKVKARVQGSRPKPYDVTINVKTLDREEWERVIVALSEQAIFAAKLLAGEMPQNIESVFQSAHLSLFPARISDLETDCSCPDWSNPCKHSAAVYCLLGEEFDRDPFLLFRLRGITREALLEGLTGRGAGTDAEEEAASAPEPLHADPNSFWGGSPLPSEVWGEVRIPPVTAALIKRAGAFPFWRGDTPFQQALEPFYVRASARGRDVFLGKSTS